MDAPSHLTIIFIFNVCYSTLCWTESETGAYGFGLNFRVRACVHASATISQTSDMYGLILFVLGTKTTHDGIHKHIILFHDAV